MRILQLLEHLGTFAQASPDFDIFNNFKGCRSVFRVEVGFTDSTITDFLLQFLSAAFWNKA